MGCRFEDLFCCIEGRLFCFAGHLVLRNLVFFLVEGTQDLFVEDLCMERWVGLETLFRVLL